MAIGMNIRESISRRVVCAFAGYRPLHAGLSGGRGRRASRSAGARGEEKCEQQGPGPKRTGVTQFATRRRDGQLANKSAVYALGIG